jgi:hypothetical protein
MKSVLLPLDGSALSARAVPYAARIARQGHCPLVLTRALPTPDERRDGAYHIAERKGATYYAVAVGLMQLVEAILRDQGTVLSVTSLIDLCLSLPAVVGRGEAERVLRLTLVPSEAEARATRRRVARDRYPANPGHPSGDETLRGRYDHVTRMTEPSLESKSKGRTSR